MLRGRRVARRRIAFYHDARLSASYANPRRLRLAARQLQPEVMDQPGLDPDKHRQALSGLARLNWASGASGSLWSGVRRLLPPTQTDQPFRVLDVASGGGDITCGLARRAKHVGAAMSVHGLDFNATAVEFARERVRPTDDVTFGVGDVLTGELPAGYDIVTCSLFLHHLTEEQAMGLLRRMTAAAGLGVVISDLRRSWTSYALAAAACRILSRSPVVAVDGPRSVEGAFTIDEFGSLTTEAGIPNASLRPAWPQRFLASWQTKSP